MAAEHALITAIASAGVARGPAERPLRRHLPARRQGAQPLRPRVRHGRPARPRRGRERRPPRHRARVGRDADQPVAQRDRPGRGDRAQAQRARRRRQHVRDPGPPAPARARRRRRRCTRPRSTSAGTPTPSAAPRSSRSPSCTRRSASSRTRSARCPGRWTASSSTAACARCTCGSPRTTRTAARSRAGCARRRASRTCAGRASAAWSPSATPTRSKIASATKVFSLAESLGGVESLIEVPQAMTHQSVEGSDGGRARRSRAALVRDRGEPGPDRRPRAGDGRAARPELEHVRRSEHRRCVRLPRSWPARAPAQRLIRFGSSPSRQVDDEVVGGLAQADRRHLVQLARNRCEDRAAWPMASKISFIRSARDSPRRGLGLAAAASSGQASCPNAREARVALEVARLDRLGHRAEPAGRPRGTAPRCR